ASLNSASVRVEGPAGLSGSDCSCRADRLRRYLASFHERMTTSGLMIESETGVSAGVLPITSIEALLSSVFGADKCCAHRWEPSRTNHAQFLLRLWISVPFGNREESIRMVMSMIGSIQGLVREPTGGRSRGFAQGLADLPMVAVGIDNASNAPTVALVDGPNHLCSWCYSTGNNGVRIGDDHHDPHRTAAEGLRAEIQVLRRFVSDPEFSLSHRELSHHRSIVIVNAKQHSGAKRLFIELDGSGPIANREQRCDRHCSRTRSIDLEPRPAAFL